MSVHKECNFCGNKAITKSYREFGGIVSSTRECEKCLRSSKEGIIDRGRRYKEFMDNLDTIMDKAMGDFWDSVNNQIFDLILHEDEWSEIMADKISKKLKSENK